MRPKENQTTSTRAAASPISDGPIGERYRLVRLLGRGGLGEVHEVCDESNGRSLALKLLRLREGTDVDKARQLFEREYHTLDQLAHPSIIDVYDYGFHNRSPFYTMELLSGEDLGKLGALDWREAAKALIEKLRSNNVI